MLHHKCATIAPISHHHHTRSDEYYVNCYDNVFKRQIKTVSYEPIANYLFLPIHVMMSRMKVPLHFFSVRTLKYIFSKIANRSKSD